MGNLKYAGIVIDQAHPALDKIFHYLIPEQMKQTIKIGMRVSVPFGNGNKELEGYILRVDSEIDVPENKLKTIYKILDPYPILSAKTISLINWMKNEYHCLTIEAIRCFVPAGARTNTRRNRQKIVSLESEEETEERILFIQNLSPNMAEILRTLDQYGNMLMSELLKITGASPSSIKSLEKRNWVVISDDEVYEENDELIHKGNQEPFKLTSEQEEAISTIEDSLASSRSSSFLLHGVTGSGKTEVYIQIVQRVIAMGRQAIVLVPEISLTPQTMERFKKRFGDQVAILHSRLSLVEKSKEWKKIRNGEVNIVVGARSAIFAPLERLGVIIIDEAHETTYKSESRPRYQTVDVARKRCELDGAIMILGSATPNIEDYYMAKMNEIQYIPMRERVDNRPMPQVEIVDMRKEIEEGNRTIFSKMLFSSIKRVLYNREQAILLLNRRGYASFVSCRSCGYVVKCLNCDISLTYHHDTNNLKCHYCGNQYPYPTKCPVCNSKYIKYFGTGTQKVEEEVKRFFPNARVIRMDMDTTSRKGAHEKILKEFGEGKFDILLGTQMIAKGLDFPNVTFVGVIIADTILNLPEYRSSEKTFQLITQVAGRTGRGLKEGKVVVQTYQPEHQGILFAAKHDYHNFYQWEIDIRRKFQYPPFSHIIRILLTGKNERSLITLAESVKLWLNEKIDKNIILKEGTIEFGAYPAPLEKINNKYRWQILIKIRTDKIFIQAFHELMDECIGKFIPSQETIVVDFYPTSLL